MTRVFLELLNSRIKFPSLLICFALRVYNRIYQLFKFKTLWSGEERSRIETIILSTNKKESIPPSNNRFGSLTLNIVATDKDIELLIQVILFSIRALSNFEICSIRIIVPENQLNTFSNLLHNSLLPVPAEVVGESQIVPYEIGRDIFQDKFPERQNWCYQQFLKLESVLSSESKFALVVDCDTVLLNPRAWLNADRETNVMPTFEYQPQYEDLLRRLGVKNLHSEWSFVPHHMLYKVDYLRRILKDLGIENIRQLAMRVENLADDHFSSPFCLDYSLYGHSVYSESYNKSLIRWANLEVPRRFAFLFKVDSTVSRLTALVFNSISFHSWKGK